MTRRSQSKPRSETFQAVWPITDEDMPRSSAETPGQEPLL